jgi:AcrR family transcriptional regulator
MGRLRTFDIEKAIDIATELFWKKGYEQTSVADLTEDMGIAPPSFYSAFESKDGLFRKVIHHYTTKYLGFMEDAFRQPTARGVAETMLYGCADVYSDPANPGGCLLMNSSLPSLETTVGVRQELATQRKARRTRLRKRFQEAKASGDLPSDADPEELARFVMSIGWGLAVDAQSGASKRDLYRTVARAMRAWPSRRNGPFVTSLKRVGRSPG